MSPSKKALPQTVAEMKERSDPQPVNSYRKPLTEKATVGEAQALAVSAVTPALIAARLALRFAVAAFVVSLGVFVLVLWRTV